MTVNHRFCAGFASFFHHRSQLNLSRSVPSSRRTSSPLLWQQRTQLNHRHQRDHHHHRNPSYLGREGPRLTNNHLARVTRHIEAVRCYAFVAPLWYQTWTNLKPTSIICPTATTTTTTNTTTVRSITTSRVWPRVLWLSKPINWEGVIIITPPHGAVGFNLLPIRWVAARWRVSVVPLFTLYSLSFRVGVLFWSLLLLLLWGWCVLIDSSFVLVALGWGIYVLPSCFDS